MARQRRQRALRRALHGANRVQGISVATNFQVARFRGAPSPKTTICGFTLVELLIALALLALISALLYGSLSLSSNSWDRGEQKVEQTIDMRLTEELLRQTLTAQHP